MKKITLILLALIWISGLIILIVALTDLIPSHPFKEFRLIIGLGFAAITGLLGLVFRKLLNI